MQIDGIYGSHVYIIPWFAVDINTFVPVVCHQRTGGNLFIQFLFDVFLTLFLISFVAGWIFMLIHYIFSSERKYRRELRKKLKDKSLPERERNIIQLELLRREIVGKF